MNELHYSAMLLSVIVCKGRVPFCKSEQTWKILTYSKKLFEKGGEGWAP